AAAAPPDAAYIGRVHQSLRCAVRTLVEGRDSGGDSGTRRWITGLVPNAAPPALTDPEPTPRAAAWPSGRLQRAAASQSDAAVMERVHHSLRRACTHVAEGCSSRCRLRNVPMIHR